MIEPLLTRLANRLIFVGGKGGVGKTTTAGGIALALADRGARVTLISTDPAHSISDLFGSLSDSCSDRLTLEEFNARNYADAFFRRVHPALVTLVESGTYLDTADANVFLDLSLPGIDEVMAALRLVDLVRTSENRIVVDTAPTGHTLRLLQSAEILRSWVAAGRAMAEKGGAVASQLMRQPVRLPGEDVLDQIEAYAATFESQVLRGGAFVVVTRGDAVTQAETVRLKAMLRTRGVHVAATIINQATSPEPETFPIPHLPAPTGCSGLREWARRVGEQSSHSSPSGALTTQGDAADELSRVQARLVWVAGKGGVGKSTCAAALATFFAESRTVRIASTDPAGSLGDVFSVNIDEADTPISPRLYARQIDAPARFAQMRSDYRAAVEQVFESLGLERAAALDRRVIEALFDFAPPGIDEIIALLDIMEHLEDYDVTVIDSAPTGHFLRLLDMPDIALEWVHALMRLLVKYHALGSLDALGHDLLAFSKRLRQLKLDLSSPEKTAVYVVTLAQPMVIAETQRLLTALDHASIPVAAVIVNRGNEDDAHKTGKAFDARAIIRAPDAGAEIIGSTALRTFLTRWEKLG